MTGRRVAISETVFFSSFRLSPDRHSRHLHAVCLTFGNVFQKGDGEQDPPEGHGEKGQFDGGGTIGQSNEVGFDHGEDLEAKQQDATKVTDGESQSRNVVSITFATDVREQRIVKDVPTIESDRRDNIYDARKPPLSHLDKSETGAG